MPIPAPAEKPAPAPEEKPAAPAEKPAPAPAEKPAPAPAEKPAPAPAEKPAPAPAEKPAPAPEKPAPAPDKPAPEKPDVDPFSQNDGGLRIWTDSSGKFTVEARYVGTLDGGTVRLQKAGGQYLRVSLHRLSAADQTFVLGMSKAIVMN